jgi:hypothetical protein
MLTCKCSVNPKASVVPFVRVIQRGLCMQREYTRGNAPPCTHLGQMKLLLSEIDFLTPFFGRSLRVIYAGAAPGVHIPILVKMFPTMQFVLVDPQAIMEMGEPNVSVRQEYMTDDLAREFAANGHGVEGLLFISDVRVGPPIDGESADGHQDRIQRDMDAQRRWLELMCPLASILKFRLPWREGVTNYPSGRIYFPVYGKRLTHEARLVVPKDAPPVDYENRVYEGQMAYFNQVLRPATFRAFAGGRCYDCTSFRWIVCQFLYKSSERQFDLGSWPESYGVIDAKCFEIERELARLKAEWLGKTRRG